MPFSVNANLLAHSRAALWQWEGLFWIVGGAGSGKTTVCEILSARFGILVYDMDARQPAWLAARPVFRPRWARSPVTHGRPRPRRAPARRPVHAPTSALATVTAPTASSP
jgi:hypothetical protein